ncbi:MAG: HD domain-containing protein [Bacillota bacterium]|nr:HD domain-containing protein [Bacillota bacterium]
MKDKMMERVNKILASREYRDHLERNALREGSRLFCQHHFEHLLTVARLTYLLLIEEGCPFITRETAYAAGLLHDIGRWQEYDNGTDHALASAELARTILEKVGFSNSEMELITRAIAQHRLKSLEQQHLSPLSKALAKADQYSRLCFGCQTRSECHTLDRQPHKEELIY